ncbi:MAG: hypothetical protein GWO24_18620 [Akkermansiaceae bacterium]|nr:hypothetical protein [Akkermansiaceae bacterium]
MKRQISSDKLYESYLVGRLGTEGSYYLWTPLWALRSRLWRKKRLRKLARNSLGDIAMEAIDDGDPGILRQLAVALDEMLQSEREPGYAVRADVFFAVEELNENFPAFTRADLWSWLNDEMEAVVSKGELEEALGQLGLLESVPKGKRKIR